MGFRLHQRTKNLIETDVGVFNHLYDELLTFLQDECDRFNVCYVNEGHAYWEIHKDSLKKAIKTLDENYEFTEIVFADWTAQKLRDTFERWLNINKNNKKKFTNPNWIYLDWY